MKLREKNDDKIGFLRRVEKFENKTMILMIRMKGFRKNLGIKTDFF